MRLSYPLFLPMYSNTSLHVFIPNFNRKWINSSSVLFSPSSSLNLSSCSSVGTSSGCEEPFQTSHSSIGLYALLRGGALGMLTWYLSPLRTRGGMTVLLIIRSDYGRQSVKSCTQARTFRLLLFSYRMTRTGSERIAGREKFGAFSGSSELLIGRRGYGSGLSGSCYLSSRTGLFSSLTMLGLDEEGLLWWCRWES